MTPAAASAWACVVTGSPVNCSASVSLAQKMSVSPYTSSGTAVLTGAELKIVCTPVALASRRAARLVSIATSIWSTSTRACSRVDTGGRHILGSQRARWRRE